ncbi:MAG: phosphoenolpyruvate carboxylase [Halobellus sp.]|uniref:phosphoenolpyruvate carboxylase n=1 Tax=Halobellus sp. TaxID=1979212 RepID=UPI0035D4B13E
MTGVPDPHDPPRVMSTQHPDNATVPFFTEGEVIEGEEEVREAYYAYSHLGCDEQMWDFEGKEGDEYAVKKLLSRFDDHFADERLGAENRLTLRGPNPDLEKSEAKILLEILESIPRSYDAAEAFYQSLQSVDGREDHETVAPIHEVIVPMVTSASQINAVHDYYEEFVVGKADRSIGGRTVADWVGHFRPDEVAVIPLIEDREYLLNADEILRGYLQGRDRDAQRVFLARSDPALNYGSLAADLVNKVSLRRLYHAAADLDVELYPILGAGPAPFRGGLAPDTVDRVLDTYPEVETFTVQSGFKYDHPPQDVQAAIERLRTAERDRSAPDIDESLLLEVADRVAERYSEQVSEVAPIVNRLAEYVPRRRDRKLHVGLFGYSREVGEIELPRAITYTASLYSIGFPPTLMGLAGLEDADWTVVDDCLPRFHDLLADAARYYNPRSLSMLPLDEEEVRPGLDRVDVDPDPDHRAATDDVIDALDTGGDVRSGVVRAARCRQFLG